MLGCGAAPPFLVGSTETLCMYVAQKGRAAPSLFQDLPEKPVALNDRLPVIHHRLLWGIVAWCSGQLGFPGSLRLQKRQSHNEDSWKGV